MTFPYITSRWGFVQRSFVFNIDYKGLYPQLPLSKILFSYALVTWEVVRDISCREN